MDAATAHTVEFLLGHVRPGQRLLEVGCGDGRVARELLDRGCDVVAIDSSREAVALARGRGVAAQEANFLEFEDDPFDVVFLSRALHHIEPLEQAVACADALLATGGRAVVEDFAFEAADAETLRWFYGLGTVMHKLGLADEFPAAIPGDCVGEWTRQHFDHHGIATRAEMLAALAARFTLVVEDSAAYLYRYFADDVPDEPRRQAAIAAIRAWEQRLAGEGAIRAVGWRSVWERGE